MSDNRVMLTAAEAIGLLPDGETVHTFMSLGGILIGCDHDRDRLIADITAAEERGIAGSMARGMGHALVIWAGDRPLFVEAVEERIAALEAERAEAPAAAGGAA